MTIKVHYDNGDSITTRFNGTAGDAARYYIDRIAVFGSGEEGDPERFATCRAIEYLDGAPVRRFDGGGYARLKRVFSLSRGFMKRHNLYYKYRDEWEVKNLCGNLGYHEIRGGGICIDTMV